MIQLTKKMCIFAVDFKAVYYDFPLVLFCDMIVETSMHCCDALGNA